MSIHVVEDKNNTPRRRQKTSDDFRMRTKRKQKWWTNLWGGRIHFHRATTYQSGSFVHLTSKGKHTHHNTIYMHFFLMF